MRTFKKASFDANLASWPEMSPSKKNRGRLYHVQISPEIPTGWLLLQSKLTWAQSASQKMGRSRGLHSLSDRVFNLKKKLATAQPLNTNGS
jgi:hypothetical protein